MCFKVNSKMPGGINLGWNAFLPLSTVTLILPVKKDI